LSLGAGSDVDLVRAAYDALNRRDLAEIFRLTDPDFGLRTLIGETFQGHEGLEAWLEQLLGAFDDYRADVEEVLHTAGGLVVVVVRRQARGKGSGVPVQHRFAHVWRVRANRLISMHAYTDPADALAAVRIGT
jgi:ketosteroid isomerase-like protein